MTLLEKYLTSTSALPDLLAAIPNIGIRPMGESHDVTNETFPSDIDPLLEFPDVPPEEPVNESPDQDKSSSESVSESPEFSSGDTYTLNSVVKTLGSYTRPSDFYELTTMPKEISNSLSLFKDFSDLSPFQFSLIKFVFDQTFVVNFSDHLAIIEPTPVVSNLTPLATPDAYVMNEDGVLTIGSPGILNNDRDGDGDPLTAVLQTNPTNGSLTLNPDGSFVYTPDPGFHGVDTFTYRVDDGEVQSNPTTVTITVNPVNDPPVAVNDAYSTDELIAITVPASGILSNDTDIQNDPLSAILVSGPSNGTLSLNPNGSFTYTPNGGFVGVDTFTYRANDGTDNSNVATVTITVNPVSPIELIINTRDTLDTVTLANHIGAVPDINDPSRRAIRLNIDGTGTRFYNVILPLLLTQGTSGNDIMTGDETSNSFYGYGGDDIMYGDYKVLPNHSFTFATQGNPTTLTVASGDTLDGGDGNDTLTGTAANLTLTVSGTDNLAAGSNETFTISNIQGNANPTSTNTITGGEGNDTIYGNTQTFDFNVTQGRNHLFGDNNNISLTPTVGETLSHINTSTINANITLNTPSFSFGSDILSGGAGADILYGDTGDVNIGVLSAMNLTAGDMLNANATAQARYSSASNVTSASINVQQTINANVTVNNLTGTFGNESSISGGAGADIIYGDANTTSYSLEGGNSTTAGVSNIHSGDITATVIGQGIYQFPNNPSNTSGSVTYTTNLNANVSYTNTTITYGSDQNMDGGDGNDVIYGDTREFNYLLDAGDLLSTGTVDVSTKTGIFVRFGSASASTNFNGTHNISSNITDTSTTINFGNDTNMQGGAGNDSLYGDSLNNTFTLHAGESVSINDVSLRGGGTANRTINSIGRSNGLTINYGADTGMSGGDGDDIIVGDVRTLTFNLEGGDGNTIGDLDASHYLLISRANDYNTFGFLDFDLNATYHGLSNSGTLAANTLLQNTTLNATINTYATLENATIHMGSDHNMQGGDGADTIYGDSQGLLINLRGGNGNQISSVQATSETRAAADTNSEYSSRTNATANATINSYAHVSNLVVNYGDENIINGGAGNDLIYGDTSSLGLYAYGGNNAFAGSASATTIGDPSALQGGTSNLIAIATSTVNVSSSLDATLNFGDDINIQGGGGHDTIYGDFDTFTLLASGGADAETQAVTESETVTIPAEFTTITTDATVSLDASVSVSLRLNFGNDDIRGDGSGIEGNDRLYGDGHTLSLTLQGGTNATAASGSILDVSVSGNIDVTFGNDTLNGDGGNDLLVGDLDRLTINATDGSGSGAGSFDVSASLDGSSLIFGNDTLIGGGGNDTLIGDALHYNPALTTFKSYATTYQWGDDTLTGGSGADRFIFTLEQQGGGLHMQGVDIITDFNLTEDTLTIADVLDINGDLNFNAADLNLVSTFVDLGFAGLAIVFHDAGNSAAITGDASITSAADSNAARAAIHANGGAHGAIILEGLTTANVSNWSGVTNLQVTSDANTIVV